MTAATLFTVTPYQNTLLCEGDDTTDVVVTVAASPSLQRTADRAEVVIVDNSGSMALENKLSAAKNAAKAAVDCLDDGVEFAVVVGNDDAKRIWPPPDGDRALAVSDQSEQKQAQDAIDEIQVDGATNIGSWLDFARNLLATTAAQLRHVLLLSDGRDSAQDGVLQDATTSCVGVFQCDCLGFGTSWRVEELRGIARALGGQVDMVAAASGLAGEAELVDHFRRIVATSQARVLPAVRMRVVTKTFADLLAIEQSSPEFVPLTESGATVASEPGTTEIPLWGWAPGERRDYFLSFRLRPRRIGRIGERVRVAFVDLVANDGSTGGRASIEVRWTIDRPKATQVEPAVAWHSSQRDKAEKVLAALAALANDDRARATLLFVEAKRAAAEAGDESMLALIDEALELDPESGEVAVERVSEADRLRLETYSSRTGRREPLQDQQDEDVDDVAEEGDSGS